MDHGTTAIHLFRGRPLHHVDPSITSEAMRGDKLYKDWNFIANITVV
jgi:hypothetical protein